jgi:hypothetical protein
MNEVHKVQGGALDEPQCFWWTVPGAAPRNIARDHGGAETECKCTSMRVKSGQDVKQARTFSSFTCA